MLNENTDPSGREQRTTLLLPAPIEQVWEMWTNPEHIQHWWGPHGFTNTIEVMQVVPGGEWIFTMHGPDGEQYPNRTLFREVIPFQKLVHEHFAPNFIAIITFNQEGPTPYWNGTNFMRPRNCLIWSKSSTKAVKV